MREIKFRGKRTDNGEWVYGALISRNGLTCIVDIESKTALRSVTTHCADKYDFRSIEVIPETVGQYTGLKDKNGVEIYEGDIVRDLQTGRVACVIFLQQEMGYVLVFKGYDSRLGHRKRGGSYYIDSTIEVIGNTYENPELTEGK